MVVIREPRTFDFNFDFPKDVGKNLKHEIGIIIKNNKSLTQIKQFLSRYKHVNNIHEHEKQQKE